MQRCDSLIIAGWCIPVEPHNLVLRDHAIAIDGGRIVDVLPSAEARQRYHAGSVVERPGHALIPGFVNAHTHAAMTLFRGIADDLPLERWLSEGIWPIEARFAGPEMVRDGTRLAIAEMLLSGCTCFSDQYFFPETVAATAVDLHMRAMNGTPVIEFETAWAASAAECLDKGVALVHDAFAESALVSSCFAPHSCGTVSDESFSALRIIAGQLDLRVQIHLHESAGEIQDALVRTGKRPFARLRELGLVNASLLAVHAVHLADDEISEFAESGVNVAHCPRSNLKLADGIARVADLQKAGVNVALGTDGAASNNVLDMLGEMRTAALLAKARANDAGALPAAAALRMATIDGARSIGLESSIGTLEIGKWADISCIDLQRINSQPMYDPLSQIVYTTQPDQIRDVWVGGRHQVENGRLTHINEADLLQRCAEWQRQFSADNLRANDA